MAFGEGPIRGVHENRGGAVSSLFIIAAACIALAASVYVGASHFMEYDGWWHVFVARVDDWSRFAWEYKVTAHPPLFFLALKAACALGTHPLVYRLVSILAGAASILLLGRIVQRYASHWLTPLAAVTAFGFSFSYLTASIQVRSYMLCCFFLLLSVHYWLKWVEHRPDARTLIWFTASMCFALLTHFFAMFVWAACAMAILWMTACDPAFRNALVSFFRSRPVIHLAIALTPAALSAFLFVQQAQQFAFPIDYMSAHYFQPGGIESPLAFLLRNTRNLFNLFSPLPVVGDTSFAAVLGVLLVAAVAAVYYLLLREDSRNLAAAGALLVFLLTLAGVAGAAVFGKYPYGGFLRHQFLLFPIAVLGLALAADRLPGRARTVILVAGLLIALGNGARLASTFQIARDEDPILARYDVYFREFPAAQAVYTDGFNRTLFFARHHDWDFRYEGVLPGLPAIQQFTFRRGERKVRMLFDTTRWNLEMDSEPVYEALAYSAQSLGADMGVFCLRQIVPPARGSKQDAYRHRILTLGRKYGMSGRVVLNEYLDTFAEFRLEGKGPLPPELTGLYPSSTVAGQGFNVLPSGESAIAVTCQGEPPAATIVFAGRSLPTTAARDRCLVTAPVPADLIRRVGDYEVYVKTRSGESNRKRFQVRPRP